MKNSRFSERAALTIRGYKLLSRYCPGLARSRALSTAVTSVLPFVTVFASARIINGIERGDAFPVLLIWAAVTVAANFAAAAIKGVFERIAGEKESAMFGQFAKIFADKQMASDFEDLEDGIVQRKKKRAEEDLFMFGNGLGQLVWGTNGLVGGTISIISAAVLIAPLFFSRGVNPLAVALLIGLIAAAGAVNSLFTVKENEVFERWCAKTVWFNRVFMFFGRELYMNADRAKDVRVYRQDRTADRELSRLCEHEKSAETNSAITRMALCPSAAAIFIGIVNTLCILFVAVTAMNGGIGVGGIVMYTGALSMLGEGVRNLMYTFADNAVCCSHMRGLFDYLDTPSRMANGSRAVKKQVEHTIKFENVRFKYANSDCYALDGLSITITPNKRLAVVGLNGSGKTTFIKLLCRLYDPDEGLITLDGVDIREYDRDEYIALFSVVFQDFKLLSLPLGQNIAAAQTFDHERAEQCLRRAGMGGRLDEMRSGLDTLLGTDNGEGEELSGGEAQKTALARAIYRDAEIMILDEPTAALDPIAETEVYSGFDALTGKKTAVYISHRLSSCRFCDEIAVFDGGRIVQRGRHEELASEPGLYRELWNAQAKYYVEDGEERQGV